MKPDSPETVLREERIRYLRLKWISEGLPAWTEPSPSGGSLDFETERLLSGLSERVRLLGEVRCPTDQRLEQFLRDEFASLELSRPLRLPARTLVLNRPGLARELSLPIHGDTYCNQYVQSYRTKNGVLHNPRADRRTTTGTFHITEGWRTVPLDKLAVPRRTFAKLFELAWQAPPELMIIPFTSETSTPVESFISLLIRPRVAPGIQGVCPERSMEIRFFAPAGLVSNLDFVETIFGNAGDPFLPECDAGLDVEHWTGHTGCVILAPHLCQVTKRDAGLPHYSDATARQRDEGMCWQTEDELYNGGQPFKLTCRNETGRVVTLIADNYYGYCKKEVKTQISFAANLMGNVEEEHAGGAIAFASFNLGDEFQANSRRYNGRTFADLSRDYSSFIDIKAEGYGVDKIYPDLIYIPENAHATLQEQHITWTLGERTHTIPLLPGKIYMAPSGYRLHMDKHPAAPTWRLIGTAGEGIACHKPCTVSGGGKSEISKSLLDYMLYGPIFVADVKRDLEFVQQIFDRDYGTRWRSDSAVRRARYEQSSSRSVLDPRRSLGSVIKLLTPSPEYTDDYNAWLASIPNYVYSLVFIIKRFQAPDWGADWKKRFSVDIVNGVPGHELKYKQRKLVGSYLRVGFDQEGNWRTFKLRQDFAPAAKIATQDDITVSTVVPAARLKYLNPQHQAASFKFVMNCEQRLFQRPDDAVHRGLDRQTEADMARSDNFMSNFEPLSATQVREMVEHVVDLDEFTPPMQHLLREVAADGSGYVVCSARPRLVDGVPTKNPRYLQLRPDLARPFERYVAEMGTRLFRAIPADEAVPLPVNSVLFGRRNNPPAPKAGIRGLAVFSPLHYQELPELFMDFVSSLTGKSPSTTGAGSEGALTKGPFNALPAIIDLNNALVSFLLTQFVGFSTAAGHVGPNTRVDHDISLLVPEIWCRLSPEEREPRFLLDNQLFEPLEDFDFEGERILASRLGFRMTERFVRWFGGRIFDNPAKVFDDALLRPETQDPAAFADGIKYICEAHARVARLYFADGTIELACPPLRALLTIMAQGQFEGKDVHHPDIRQMFTLEYLLASDWYKDRLRAQAANELWRWQAHVEYLRQYLQNPQHAAMAQRLGLEDRLRTAERELARVSNVRYLDELLGTLGLDPAMSRSAKS